MIRTVFEKALGVAVLTLALCALPSQARADSIPPPDNTHLGTLVSVINMDTGQVLPTGPYGSIYVNFTSNSAAQITVIADPDFLFGGQNAFGFNTTFSGTISDVRFSGDSPSPPDTTITVNGSGSGPSGTGTFTFNFSFNDGHDAAVSELQFTFTLSAGTFTSGAESAFLTLNASGNDAYAHIFPRDTNALTGFATETALGTCPNADCRQSEVPEPASLLLLGTGLGFVGKQVRRRTRRERA